MVIEAFAFTDAIQLLVAIITVAGIFDLLLTAIAERRAGARPLASDGADDHVVRRSIVIESATIGVLGATARSPSRSRHGVRCGSVSITASCWVTISSFTSRWESVAWYLAFSSW